MHKEIASNNSKLNGFPKLQGYEQKNSRHAPKN